MYNKQNKQNNQNQTTKQGVRDNGATSKNRQALKPILCSKSLAPLALAIAALIGTSTPAQALKIHFNFASDTSLVVRENFHMAAEIWEGLLSDATDVRIEVGMVDFAGEFGDDYENVLGLALPEFWDVDFYEFETALEADRTSSDDHIAVANLDLSQVEEDYDMILTKANAKALGLYDGSSTAYDGQIRLNSSYNWDYDFIPNTGTTGLDQFHYLSVAIHEIAHVLGFTSGLDSNDWVTANSEGNSTPEGQTALGQFTALDAFRYDELGNLNVEQVTDPDTQRFFSLDGGTTNLTEFSTGVTGDGYQASHWKNDKFIDEFGNLVVNDAIGIMDPAFGMGERGAISALDLQGLDAIGWNLTGESWDDLDMMALAAQASSDASMSVMQDLLEQFAASQGLAWWRWWGWRFYWAVTEDELLASAQSNNSSSNDDLSEMLAYAANLEPSNLNSLPPATSVPEPGATAALIGVGLLGLRSRRKRYQNK